MNNDNDKQLDSGNTVGYIMAGVGLLALITISIFSVPAWIWLVVMVVAGIVFSGGDLALAETQLYRREQAKQEAKSQAVLIDLNTPIYEQQQEAYRKAEVLANDTERTALLKDLAIIDVDVSKFEMVDKADIEKALTKEERIVLREMRGFLK